MEIYEISSVIIKRYCIFPIKIRIILCFFFHENITHIRIRWTRHKSCIIIIVIISSTHDIITAGSGHYIRRTPFTRLQCRTNKNAIIYETTARRVPPNAHSRQPRYGSTYTTLIIVWTCYEYDMCVCVSVCTRHTVYYRVYTISRGVFFRPCYHRARGLFGRRIRRVLLFYYEYAV